MRRFSFFCVLAVLVTVLHYSVLPQLFSLQEKMNLFLVVGLLVTFTVGIVDGLLFFVLAGILFDQYSLLPPGSMTLSGAAAVTIAYTLSLRYFSNRSLASYSILTILAAVLWAGVFWVLWRTGIFLGWALLAPTDAWWRELPLQVTMTCALVIGTLALARMLQKRRNVLFGSSLRP